MNIGTAQIDITPAAGGELSGFAARQQPSVGVFDRLFARAIYLTAGAQKLLWLHCDLIGFEVEIVAEFRHWARASLGLHAAELLLTATHTHSGPATLHLEGAGTYDRSYVTFLQACLQRAALQAMARVEPGAAVTGDGSLSLAIDRRRQPSAHIDSRVGVVSFQRADGTFIAAIANYPIHPVALGAQNRCVSGDLFGVAADELALRLPGRPVVLVTNGACGNLNPPLLDVSPEQNEIWGRAIGRAAAQSLAAARMRVAPELRTAVATIPLPLDVLDCAGIEAHAEKILAVEGRRPEAAEKIRRVLAHWKRSLFADLESGEPCTARPVELFAVRLADLTFVGVNAEVFSIFTDWLRRELGPRTFTLGYANGDLGYLCPRAAYAEGGYEVDAAHLFYGGYRFKEGALERLAREAIGLVQRELAAPDGETVAPGAQ